MKITIDDINVEQLVAVATALKNGVVPVAVSASTDTQDEVVEEPSEDTIDFDKEGLPWDERIHSSNHKLTAQGVWTRRRGISDEVYESVKAELLDKCGCAKPIVESEPEAPVSAPVQAPVTPTAPAAMPAQSVFDTFSSKLQYALANKLIEGNYMQGLLNDVNAAFGSAYKGMFEMRDNDNAMQFVINELAKKGI